MDAPLPLAIAWYGKLPSRGDFVGEGLPGDWQRLWDDWLQRGLAHAEHQLGSSTLRERLRTMPAWQWLVVPAARGLPLWCGIVAASSDRVGRAFPLLLAEAYEESALDALPLARIQRRGLMLRDAMVVASAAGSPDEFGLAAEQCCQTVWPDSDAEAQASLPTLAALRRLQPAAASFWWCLAAPDRAPEPLAEAWPPRDALVLELLGTGG